MFQLHSFPRIVLLTAFCAATLVHAQTEISAFTTTGRAAATTFVTDYQAIGINPANLGWQWRHENKHFAFGLAEGTYSIYSDALSRDDMRNRVLNTNFTFTEAEKEQAGRVFADAGATLNADVMSFGLAYSGEGIGGLAFQMRDRMQLSARFGPRMAELMFEGYRADYFDLLVLATGDTVTNYANMSADSLALVVLGVATQPQALGRLVNGSHMGFTWYREFNLSYGKAVVRNEDVEIDLGVGFKYLVGIGIVDIRAENDALEGFSSLSPDFEIDYETGSRSEGARLTAGKILFPQPVGRGFGVDVGISAIIEQRWKFGAAVTNLGSINWTGNVYTANDGSLVDLATDGLDNYNFFEGIEDFATNSGLLEWEKGKDRRVPLASTARIGLGRVFGELAEIGVDVVLPLNDEPGSLMEPVIGVGGDVRPFQWVQFSMGLVTGGTYDTKLPVGVTFIAGDGTWEAGVASRDAITFFTDRNPTVSLSMGFLRFRF
ncbi:MAG: DUF5723 family protein [Flavobacteriales bacterium]|nr:hypothetical protein [Flavobacteriales bacterium]